MYFELTAPNQVAYARATWEAEMLGLDPEAAGSLTFNIGTGSTGISLAVRKSLRN